MALFSSAVLVIILVLSSIVIFFIAVRVTFRLSALILHVSSAFAP